MSWTGKIGSGFWGRCDVRHAGPTGTGRGPVASKTEDASPPSSVSSAAPAALPFPLRIVGEAGAVQRWRGYGLEGSLVPRQAWPRNPLPVGRPLRCGGRPGHQCKCAVRAHISYESGGVDVVEGPTRGCWGEMDPQRQLVRFPSIASAPGDPSFGQGGGTARGSFPTKKGPWPSLSRKEHDRPRRTKDRLDVRSLEEEIPRAMR